MLDELELLKLMGLGGGSVALHELGAALNELQLGPTGMSHSCTFSFTLNYTGSLGYHPID